MKRTTPELTLLSKLPHHTNGSTFAQYTTFNRPNTRRIFCGIEFRTWNPPAPKPILSLSGHCGHESPFNVLCHWRELDYRIDVWRITKAGHNFLKNMQMFPFSVTIC
ncbi:hypothetical protein AVEN_256968-1 [Araneus ventricosus]|uniref:Uncharacterized protein n=1 Tax=Araneus ventricosus TaxID=182803 RepID=A0A4Y2EFK7_ARAVE|nr:hypothetical protein AVEN_256968-1 [Araneus ventricosus]